METFIVAPAVPRRHRLAMLAVLGALSSFGPLSMDMYLPSTPTIAANLARDRQYVGYTLAIACGNAALITYISALPFIVEDAYHESPQLFSVFFMINSIGLVTMAQLSARLVKRVPVAWAARARPLWPPSCWPPFASRDCRACC
jgi:hypothetical protein